MLVTWTLLSAVLAAPVDLTPDLEQARLASSAELAAPSDDWRVDLARAVVQAEREVPSVVTALRGMRPITTRAGTLRFVGEPLGSDSAGAVMAVRLSAALDPAERRALADALPRTGGDWARWTAHLVRHEEDPSVKAVLLESLERAPDTTALPVLVLGLSDPDATVRAAAVRTLSDHAAGAGQATHLVPRLSDEDATVRAEASRGLGWFVHAPAWSALEGCVADGDPTVRLRALRALQRIDAQRAADSPAVRAATRDLDPKVARAARQITS